MCVLSSSSALGHGGQTADDCFWSTNIDRTFSVLPLGNVASVQQGSNTYPFATAMIGPPRCWFARPSMTVFIGCTSKTIAEGFATYILRGAASARGSSGLMQHPSGFYLGWEQADGSYNHYYGATSGFFNDPTWREFTGRD